MYQIENSTNPDKWEMYEEEYFEMLLFNLYEEE